MKAKNTRKYLIMLAMAVAQACGVLANSTFTKITTGSVVTDGGMSWAGAWVDYNNDGWPDLFVTNGDYNGNGNNFLYHNKGDGSFARVTDSPVEQDSANFRGCAWVD